MLPGKAPDLSNSCSYFFFLLTKIAHELVVGKKILNAYDISLGKIRATSPHTDFQGKVYPGKEK